MLKTLAINIKHEFSYLKDVTLRSFFGGFSLNSESIMFAWIDQNNIYLRGHDEYRSMFIELGMLPLDLIFDGSHKLLDYYKVEDELRQDRQKLHAIVQMVIKHAKQDLEEKLAKSQSRLKSLPNMTVSLEKLMVSAGIIDINIFREVGYLETYYRIKSKNPKLSINILFGLFGALHGRHVGTLSSESKQIIELAYQNFLKKK